MAKRSNAELESRIGRCAALLDEQRPGWEVEIDLERFRLDSPSDDILGQLFDSYAYGLGLFKRPKDIVREASSLKVSAAYLLGLSCSFGEKADAESAWRKEVYKRIEAELAVVKAEPLSPDQVDNMVRAATKALE